MTLGLIKYRCVLSPSIVEHSKSSITAGMVIAMILDGFLQYNTQLMRRAYNQRISTTLIRPALQWALSLRKRWLPGRII